MATLSRRSFVAAVPCLLVGGAASRQVQGAQDAAVDVPQEYPATPPNLAREIVGASHGRTDRVRELLREDAGLAGAAWNWGFGDWETAIGAASHVGRADIIEILVAHGARPTIFTLATLDNVDALRAILDTMPDASNLEGPHSISLFDHARAGKAERVMEFLEARGLKPERAFIERAAAEVYLGTYAWGDGETERFEVTWSDRMSAMMLKRTGGLSRGLIPTGPHTFHPGGGKHVNIRFEMEDNRAVRLHVPAPGRVLIAERM